MPECPLSDLSAAPIVEGIAYWEAKRGDRSMPLRRDIDPTEIPLLLPRVQIVERHGDTFRYRVSGTAIRDGYGLELTGKTLEEGGFGVSLAYWKGIYARVFAKAEPIFGKDRVGWQDRGYLTFEWAVLPVSRTGDAVDHCFVIVAPSPERAAVAGSARPSAVSPPVEQSGSPLRMADD